MSEQTVVDVPAASWVMVIQLGVYVDGEWVEYLPVSKTERHGWPSPEEAVAYWRHADRAHQFRAFRNGRETVTSIVSMSHGGVPVFRRVWFEEVSRG